MKIEEILSDIIKPMIEDAESLSIEKIDSASEDYESYQILVSSKDIGRVIGRGGKNANAIRTVVTAIAAKENMRVRLQFDSIENDNKE